MAVSRIAACRAINGLGLRQIASSPGTPTTALRASTPRNASNVCSRTQLRHQCTSNPSYNGSKKNEASSPSPPPPPPPSASQLLRAISFRSLLASLTPRGIKRMFRESPEELVLALAILAGLAGVSIYIVKLYFDYFMARQFTKYPKPVAKSLRRALYYTNISPDPNLARKYYKQALEQCNELQLDPFSDDVLGIRIQTAAWLEKIGNYQGAITVLDSVLRDCLKWVEWMENSVADGTVEKSGKPPAAKPLSENQRLAVPENGEEKVVENLWHKRTRLLAKAVGTSTKLGALYSDEHVLEPENSLARLTWAVETALTESKRRHKEGVKKDEGSWMSPEEIGGAMECWSPMKPPISWPLSVNNLAAAFAQHPLQTPLDTIPNAPATSDAIVSPDMPTDRAGLLEAAKNWASNAYSHSKDVKGEDRTEECDEACAVALTNMGDIAALLGRKEDARKRFQQAIDMSRKIGFGPGISQAEEGLRKL
ncbi:TPR domain-containing protein [Colletotrichum simmondsii]|uniref:TPR domain-containing protein n=1 Tax=Colletotrichum simmondsii TaxID=703756 RepID=A0A135TU93_9PEZI|nr:TPR domain-containing protein [Colletotrichum simmondsii]